MSRAAAAPVNPTVEHEQAAPVNPTAAYLAGIGVEIDPRLLAAPDIHTLIANAQNPVQWLDKHDRPVPEEAGVELYRVEEMGAPFTDQMVRAKESEGFREIPASTGFHMRGLHTPGSERILIRTHEQRAAAEQAARMRRTQQRTGRHKTVHPAEGGAIEQTVTRVDRTVQVPLRS